MKVKGILYSLAYSREQNELSTFEIEGGIGKYYDELVGRTLDITIEVHKEKRSRNANNYLWELIGQLAKKVGGPTKDEIYIQAVRDVGVYRDLHVKREEADTIRKMWERQGTAWPTELIDYQENGDDVIIRAYYGSSTYNSAQMSRLIDYVIEDCRAVGIPTITPKELSILTSNWRGAMRQNNEGKV